MSQKVKEQDPIRKAIQDAYMEVIGLSYESKPDAMKIINAATRLALAERERCARAAEAEEELPGEMPDENWVMSQKVRLEDHLRTTVRTAKKNIASRIRNPKD
jgi:hypothetical protein